MATSPDVARWMVKELEREEALYQNVVVYDIEQKFGEEFVYINNAGNLAINKEVLDEFRKLTGEGVVWERAGRYWRKRLPEDVKGRRFSE